MRDDYIDRKIRKMAESERMEREQIKRYAIMALDES